MKKKEVVLKLQTIITFLEGLNEAQFDYGNVIRSWDYERNCCTIGCVLGWLPAMFSDDFYWILDGFKASPSLTTVKGKNMQPVYSVLGISARAHDALFYGNTNRQVLLKLPLTKLSSSLAEVILLFKAAKKEIVLSDWRKGDNPWKS